MGWLNRNLLDADVAGIQDFLDQFEPPRNGEAREALLNTTGEAAIVRNMPLPNGFAPDYVDVLLIVDKYPVRPPIGIYLLENQNSALLNQLRRVFNVFENAHYGAETIPGYQWICLHYQGDSWNYNSINVARGDNLRKFLIGFFNRCQSEIGG
jgi:hypothetical protein